MLPIGTEVEVEVDDDRGVAWWPGRVIGHGLIGQAIREGGWPVYNVEMKDGRKYFACAPECVRASTLVRGE